MLSFAWAEIKGDLRRVTALLIALILAVSSFIILTATTETQRLQVLDSVKENWRGTYDILVRPAGAISSSEAATGLIPPNFLAAIYGGITTEQLAQIRSIADVEVAAPIAMIGSIPDVAYPRVDVSELVDLRTGRALTKTHKEVSSRGGIFKKAERDGFEYFTPNPVKIADFGNDIAFAEIDGGIPYKFCTRAPETDPAFIPLCSGTSPDIAFGFSPEKPTSSLQLVTVPIPFAAIDPEAEAALVGLDSAITDGRYLTNADGPTTVAFPLPNDSNNESTLLPVILSKNIGDVDIEFSGSFSLYPQEFAERFFTEGGTAQLAKDLENTTPVSHLDFSVGADSFWDSFLSQHQVYPDVSEYDAEVHSSLVSPSRLIRSGPVDYDLSAVAEGGPITVFPQQNTSTAIDNLSPASEGPTYRNYELLSLLDGTNTTDDIPSLIPVGFYNPDAINNADNSAAPLTTYQNIIPQVSDPDAQKLLGSAAYRTDLTPSGYLQQPPAMLTTIDGFVKAFSTTAPNLTAAPISAIRIRVAGITDMDETNTEKIRIVAEKINALTGLQTDIMTGSSLAPVNITLSSGGSALPDLHLTDYWSKKGVATSITSALDKKTLFLAIAIVLSAMLTIAMTSAAMIRSRRPTLATLATLGWRPRQLAKSIYIQLAITATGAALVAAVITAITLNKIETTAPIWWPLLAFPLTWVITFLVALPSTRKTLKILEEGAHPSKNGKTPKNKRNPGATPGPLSPAERLSRANNQGKPTASFTAFSLGWKLARRHPGRLLTASIAIATALAVAQTLSWITTYFQGQIVGSVLGNTVSISVRGPDVFAAFALITLGIISIATIAWITTLEDAPIYQTLQAIGWTSSRIRVTIAAQASTSAFLGTLIGMIVHLATVSTLRHLTGESLLTSTIFAVVYLVASIAISTLIATHNTKHAKAGTKHTL